MHGMRMRCACPLPLMASKALILLLSSCLSLWPHACTGCVHTGLESAPAHSIRYSFPLADLVLRGYCRMVWHRVQDVMTMSASLPMQH